MMWCLGAVPVHLPTAPNRCARAHVRIGGLPPIKDVLPDLAWIICCAAQRDEIAYLQLPSHKSSASVSSPQPPRGSGRTQVPCKFRRSHLCGSK